MGPPIDYTALVHVPLVIEINIGALRSSASSTTPALVHVPLVIRINGRQAPPSKSQLYLS